MMRPAHPEQTASASPYTLYDPRALLLALCVAIAVLLTAASAVILTGRPAGVPVTRTAGTPASVVETSRSSLSTIYAGQASCSEPGFLTGDTIGDANPAAMYRTLCGHDSPSP